MAQFTQTSSGCIVMMIAETLMFRSLVRCLVIGALAIAGVSSDAPGQSIPSQSISSQSIPGRKSPARFATAERLPNPIRQAGYTTGVDASKTAASSPREQPDRGAQAQVAESGWSIDAGDRLDPSYSEFDQLPKHPHQILRAPSMLPTEKRSAHGHHGDAPSERWIHPPFSSHRQRIQPAPATLPGANQHSIWKTPYSYGYFGASGTRHWSLHHGARDRYTEWILK